MAWSEAPTWLWQGVRIYKLEMHDGSVKVGESHNANVLYRWQSKMYYKKLFSFILLSLESGGKDIKKVMDTWTKQIGHPVITTKRINATHIQVKQDRFNLDPPGIGI